jgi:23S rRNA (guanine2445-N2)-methyltransferase / 23S rRNA (guanine2069-N7)-methyltransferase
MTTTPREQRDPGGQAAGANVSETLYPFFVTVSRGIENLLAEEIKALGIEGVSENRGGVSFEGTLEDGYRVCLWSRTSSRVLLFLTRFEASDQKGLYDGVQSIDWSQHFGADASFAISVAGHASSSDLQNSHFVALRAKDAIVDQFRAESGSRLNVDVGDPDLRLNLHLRGSEATLAIDLLGESLHRRGIERKSAGAPLKENLAASMLTLAGWPELAQRGVPLMDPMCGSGTLLIEAVWMALDIAPGLQRRPPKFRGWLGHDRSAWKRLEDEARARQKATRERTVHIVGRDASHEIVNIARDNIRRAGLAGSVLVEVGPLQETRAPEVSDTEEPRGLVLTNPPYGERIGEAGELGRLYREIGDTLRRRFPGWRACVLSGNKALSRQIGLKAESKVSLYNGPIACQLLTYPISARPVESSDGPGWRKPSKDAPMLVNRIKKNLRKIKKWAKREEIHCYRFYDADIPEYNVALDWYDGAVHIQEYARPRAVTEHVAEKHLQDVLLTLPELLGVAEEDISLKVRRRQDAEKQYEKRDHSQEMREVREGGLTFLVNLKDYLDTGLFLDGRQQRAMMRDWARGRDVLNLFAYTCTSSVFAADGGAKSTTSVDLSKTYLKWGRRNFALNGFEGEAHQTLHADVISWLRAERRHYGLIHLAPPTYSRSKRTDSDFIIQRDHPELIQLAYERLTVDGIILFSSPFRDFIWNWKAPNGVSVEEISDRSVPLDFSRRPNIHRAWKITRSGSQ